MMPGPDAGTRDHSTGVPRPLRASDLRRTGKVLLDFAGVRGDMEASEIRRIMHSCATGLFGVRPGTRQGRTGPASG